MATYTLQTRNGAAIYRDAAEQVTLQVPAACCDGLALPSDMPVLTGESAFSDAVRKPVAGPPLAEAARCMQAKSACVLVSDATRNVPNHLVAKHVVDALLEGGVPLSGIRFYDAIGVHREATEEELRGVFPEALQGKVSIENHTPYYGNNLIYLGDTTSGTPVEVNRSAYQCDIHVSIGKTEPHEFAGFSGGRKSVLPGISSERCIIRNHRPEMLYHPKCVPGVLDGNPIHLDMLEAVNKFKIHYNINFVMTGDGEPSAVFGGTLEASHVASVAYVRQYCNLTLDRPDIIVTTPGKPLNIDFYQSMKPLIALTDILDASSVVAMYCACPEGINSDDMMRPFRETASLDEMVRYTMAHYRIQMDHALLLSKIIRKGAKIVVYSPNVTAGDIESMYFYAAETPEAMMSVAMRLSGKASPRVLFYPQAQKTLPVIR